MKKTAFVLVALALVLSACGGEGLFGAPPTLTPWPTSTPTAAPTATPTVAPTPTPDLCGGDRLRAIIIEANDAKGRFDDARTLAGSTPRMSLAPVIQNMQEIRRDTYYLQLPACASQLQEKLVGYMDATIDYCLAFMASADDVEVEHGIKLSNAANGEYLAALLSILKAATP